MADDELTRIFKRGSKTYYYNSIFFPKSVRRDVFILYAFVRKADNYVDSIPQKEEEFKRFVMEHARSCNGERSNDQVLDPFCDLCERKQFETSWVEAFLDSMRMDLRKKRYHTIDEVLEYIYGSAEVIGLMMSRIIALDPSSDDHARSLGRAMQYINFIRDINEDLDLGRIYFPLDDLDEFGLETLEHEHVRSRQEQFSGFMKKQLQRYKEWQMDAEKGFRYIPKRYLVPIMNASDMYNWTAGKIENDPMIVYRKKVKPSKLRIVSNVIRKKITL
ncbi:MAG: phytoene/squalene synthase family protein [Thermoplasmatota archaeon]